MSTINVFLVKEKDEKTTMLKKLLESSHTYHVIGIANSYKEALLMYPKLLVDIIITDIMFDGKPDGISFIENLLISKQKLCPFIYLTGFKNRHLYQRAKLTKPFAILHKPFNEIVILYTLENMIEKLQRPIDNIIKINRDSEIDTDNFFIKKKNVLHKVLLKNIIYIEVENRYCNIITEKEKFVILISLGKIKEFLDAKIFLQIHRKYIINSIAIEQIVPKDNLVILKGGHTVTLGVRYKKVFKDLIILK